MSDFKSKEEAIGIIEKGQGSMEQFRALQEFTEDVWRSAEQVGKEKCLGIVEREIVPYTESGHLLEKIAENIKQINP